MRRFFGLTTECDLTELVLLTEGKTKQIFSVPGTDDVRIVSKSDITAGDGAKRDSFSGKDIHATTTTVAVFELLNACGVRIFRLMFGHPCGCLPTYR